MLQQEDGSSFQLKRKIREIGKRYIRRLDGQGGFCRMTIHGAVKVNMKMRPFVKRISHLYTPEQK